MYNLMINAQTKVPLNFLIHHRSFLGIRWQSASTRSSLIGCPTLPWPPTISRTTGMTNAPYPAQIISSVHVQLYIIGLGYNRQHFIQCCSILAIIHTLKIATILFSKIRKKSTMYYCCWVTTVAGRSSKIIEIFLKLHFVCFFPYLVATLRDF